MKQLQRALKDDFKDPSSNRSLDVGEKIIRFEKISHNDLEQKVYEPELKEVTKVIKKVVLVKHNYSEISDEKRMELMDAIENRGEEIKSVARRLDINCSSARSIYQDFKKKEKTTKATIKAKTTSTQQKQFSFQPSKNSAFIRRTSTDSEKSDGLNPCTTKIDSHEVNASKGSLEALREGLLESKSSVSTKFSDTLLEPLTSAKSEPLKKPSQISIFSEPKILLNTDVSFPQNSSWTFNVPQPQSNQCSIQLNTTFPADKVSQCSVMPLSFQSNNFDASNGFIIQNMNINHSAANMPSLQAIPFSPAPIVVTNSQVFQGNNFSTQSFQFQHQSSNCFSTVIVDQNRQQYFQIPSVQSVQAFQPVIHVVPHNATMNHQVIQVVQNNMSFPPSQTMMHPAVGNSFVVSNQFINQPTEAKFYFMSAPM